MTVNTSMKARIGLADPPWLPLTRSVKGMGRSPQAYYDGLTIEQMCALPVPVNGAGAPDSFPSAAASP
jgi:hypothetical protein